MKLWRGTTGSKFTNKRVVFTIGNFDGLHLGHRYVIEELKRKARSYCASSLVISFYNLTKQAIPLMTFREKWFTLSNWGVDYLWLIPFRIVRNFSPIFFVDFLKQRLCACACILGEDFHFGYKRQGGVSNFKQRTSWELTVLSEYRRDSLSVRSSIIRLALERGDLISAKLDLGRAYTIIRKVSYVGVLDYPILILRTPRLALNGNFGVKIQPFKEEINYYGLASISYLSINYFLIIRLFNFSGNLPVGWLRISFLKKY